ncbi:DNA polymerase III subunit delta [Phyllobacterium phragmitis]|uniref:DNA-directed DNA polymerase n=1 Tax=Phyllobacterium phragmitis TaxID=2670329 RepID=A0A2S9IV18_9HYPH|nr:DNA polymerase III subunit delta [Phyllobacterium phragmitis]PRD44374.1 DNA polymerase III subunit delta [Phyllobacterium phragmitis]
MAQKKSHEVDAFLGRPDKSSVIVLLYGPDKGLVSERATVFARSTGLALDDPFAVIRLEADDVDSDPARLSDEARTISMFGGERLLWVRNAAGQKGLADAVKILAAEPPTDTRILIEAGDLKKSAALRTIVEGARPAMALPCYSDDSRGIDAVIDDVLSREKLQITLDARQMLRDSLGGDRLATRGELEKLCLYAHGKERITADDVREAVGDVSALSHDEIVDAILIGDIARFSTAFDRVVKSGSPPFLILNTAMRQFQQMQILRYAIEQERKPIATAVASARPPVFFNRRKLVENALGRWTGESLVRVMERLQRTILESRRNAALAIPIIRQALLAFTVEAARAGRNK